MIETTVLLLLGELAQGHCFGVVAYRSCSPIACCRLETAATCGPHAAYPTQPLQQLLFHCAVCACSDGISMGTDGMSFSLQSRDIIAGARWRALLRGECASQRCCQAQLHQRGARRRSICRCCWQCCVGRCAAACVLGVPTSRTCCCWGRDAAAQPPWCPFHAPHALCSPHPHPPADSIETVMSAQWYDANISLPGCDKNMPGTIMAMARLNRPSLMIYGGAAAGQGCSVALQQRSRRLLRQKAARLWEQGCGGRRATWRLGCLPQQRPCRGDAWLGVCGSCAASPCFETLHLHWHSSCRHHQARLLQAGR